MDHPNIVELLEVFIESQKSQIYLVFEFADFDLMVRAAEELSQEIF